MSITADNSDEEIEEERRLCYVGITRAKERLTITGARMRMMRGETQYHGISRFVKEIPEDLIQGNTWEPKPKDDFLSERPRSNRQKMRNMKKTPLAAQTYQAGQGFWHKDPEKFAGLWRGRPRETCQIWRGNRSTDQRWRS